jgi:protein SCO1/2
MSLLIKYIKVSRFLLSAFLYLEVISACAQRDPNEVKFIGKNLADIEVFDSENKRTKLSELIKDKPVILSPVYTKCPSSCSIITANLKEAVKKSNGLGKEYNIITFSFDYFDTPKELKTFKKRWNISGEEWKVLATDKENTMKILSSIDFEIIKEKSGDYLHPNVIVVITPKMKISRFVYGVFPSARDIDMAVLEAKKEKTSLSFYEGFLLNCFKFDAVAKKYIIDWAFIIQICVGIFFISGSIFFVVRDLFFKDLRTN